jgi:dTDP-4-amino-4,6-dideoxygalactose transaminase
LTSGADPIRQTDPGAFARRHREALLAAMARVLDSGWYILGGEVERFEAEFAAALGLASAVGVGNGTDALALALRGLGIGPGRRVATVSHTAVATAAAIEMAGAEPVFIDINPASYTMDPRGLEAALAAPGAPVDAVIVVHLYGQPADLPAIAALAARAGIPVIEDCAQAHGAKIGDACAGSLGAAAAFSFYPTKNLGALGDGGLVAAADPAVAARIRSLREYGWERRYVSERPGVNSRLDELQAAILRVGLPFLEAGNRRRREIAAAYTAGLAGTGLALPTARPGTTHVFHQYVIRHPDRDGLQARLKSLGVVTLVHYPVPVHEQPAYRERCAVGPAGLAATERAAREILSLPMHPELDDAAVAAVIEAVRRSL